MSPHRTVAFVQEWLPRYRLPFFNLLREVLSTQRIELRLYYGQPTEAIAKRSLAAGLPWAHQVVNSHLGPLVWQPFLDKGDCSMGTHLVPSQSSS
jgi:hypothetical protein